MYCKNCGSFVEDNASFCNNCGAATNPAAGTPNAPYTQPAAAPYEAPAAPAYSAPYTPPYTPPAAPYEAPAAPAYSAPYTPPYTPPAAPYTPAPTYYNPAPVANTDPELAQSILTKGIVGLALSELPVAGIVVSKKAKNLHDQYLSMGYDNCGKAKVGRILANIGFPVGIVMTVCWGIVFIAALFGG